MPLKDADLYGVLMRRPVDQRKGLLKVSISYYIPRPCPEERKLVLWLQSEKVAHNLELFAHAAGIKPSTSTARGGALAGVQESQEFIYSSVVCDMPRLAFTMKNTRSLANGSVLFLTKF